MLNQSLGRLQEVCRKLARHALLLNPMPSRLAPQSEVLWLRWKERKAALFEAVRSTSQHLHAITPNARGSFLLWAQEQKSY
jgi:hypothetical protein